MASSHSSQSIVLIDLTVEEPASPSNKDRPAIDLPIDEEACFPVRKPRNGSKKRNFTYGSRG